MESPVLENPLYQWLGVRPVIHAAGTRTVFGGTRMRPEVLEAMAQAARSFVPVVELNRAVGRFIAQCTGAEAGMVTGGSASGIVLSIAACMTGTDPAAIRRLPDTTGLRNELVMQKIHRGGYSEIYRYAGARLVEVGTMSDCLPAELDAAIGERTAAVGFLYHINVLRVGLTLPEVAEIAHARGVPVIVDAASSLPPRDNLRRFIREGADLVKVSGGKMIRGPQGTGLLFGRADLVEAALLNASPHNAIGRPQKVSKEDLAGLYMALKLYMESDEEAELRTMRERAALVADAVQGLPGVSAAVERDDLKYFTPTAVIRLLPGREGPSAAEVAQALLAGDPPIAVNCERNLGILAVTAINLLPGEAEIIARRLVEELTRG